jgi:hypothetical protein
MSMNQLIEEVADVSLINHIARLFKLKLGPYPHTGLRIVLLLLFAWVPLVVLSAIHGDLIGDSVRVPLFGDYTVWARFVIALPLYVVLEPQILQAITVMLKQFHDALVAEEGSGGFQAVLQSARRVRRSFVPELLILVLVGLAAVFEVRSQPAGMMSSWRWTQTASGLAPTPAALWCTWVSDSLLLYWMVWWLWSLVAWAVLMSKISKLDLRLLPTHPDRSGGLGFLGIGHVRMAAMFSPASVVVSAAVVSMVKHGDAPLMTFKVGVGAYLGIAAVLIFLPVLVFAPRLAALRRRGVIEYGALAGTYVTRFDDKWLRGGSGKEELLGSADVQSLADMGNSFSVIRDMRPIPIEPRDVAGLVAKLVLPMLPFILFVVPLKVVLAKLVQLVR